MKFLVLGGSGGCGRWIVKLACKRGHHVRAVVRENTSFDVSDDVEIIRGSVLDRDVLKQAMKGCDNVVSALGIKRKNPRNPWSKLDSPNDLTTRVAEMLVELMPKFKLNRFIGISAAGVGESGIRLFNG